ncbi:MAG TPA: DNA modification methylase [Candidatus Magasanikbacteria bacterium]|nr:DNA modification methylase [Candidatus Magasanikbacteria bacterium]
MSQLTWHTEKRTVNDLIPYEQNPRTLSDTQLKGLKRSLTKFNLVEIPAIDLDGKILAGHQRIKVLQLLGRGDEEIEVRVPSRKLSEEEFRDYLLTSNRSGGSWDWEKLASDFDLQEILIAGFDAVDLATIFDSNLTIHDDEFNEEKELKKAQNTKIKPGDMFALGRHRLICGSSLDLSVVKRLIGNAHVDLINTDTPYNINLSYDKGVGNRSSYGGSTKDNKSDEEYRVFVKTIMENALAVAKPDCHAFFWCDERYVWLFQELYKELGLDSKRLCIWIKDNASPTPNVAFNKVTEFAVYGTRGRPFLAKGVTSYNEIQNKEMGTGNQLTEDILDQLNIWLIKRLPGNQYSHPTQKPPTLHEKALRRCSKPGDIVLDLTAGSGSILSACEQLKRTAYLCELEPVFCQLIINRFKALTNLNVQKI